MNGDEDEAESQLTQVDGSRTSGSSKQTVRQCTGAGGIDISPHQQQKLWPKDRSGMWWKQCSSPGYPEAKFCSHFRMGWDTFDMICDALGSAIAKEDTSLRPSIPVRQRVAVGIWRLATGEPLCIISGRFGIGLSTCHKIVLEVCTAIRQRLMPRFLRRPDQAAIFKGSFKAISSMPDVVCVIYTTHIPIIEPQMWASKYYNPSHAKRNKKPSYSTTLQGVVDHNGIFSDVCIGWPGSMNDDEVLSNSLLQQHGCNGMMIGSWVVGGSSYPLMDWILVPYTHQNLTREQQAFNKKVAKLRHVSMDAFA
nr:protein ANTAGONIST OF LIKE HETEROCHROMATIN PROTEIN 1-like [Aegilops tauschii subsp. strangulata]